MTVKQYGLFCLVAGKEGSEHEKQHLAASVVGV